MSKLFLYFPDAMLSYFKSLNWSLVSKGLGVISNKLAEISANFNGRGMVNLFFPIDFNNFSIISLKQQYTDIKLI